MKNKIDYEWCVEECSSDDVEENHFKDSYAECLKFIKDWPLGKGLHYDIVLSVTFGNEDDGLTDQAYAHVKNGSLDKETHGEFVRKVPKRFHAEVGATKNKTKYKSLDIVAADSRIEKIEEEPDEHEKFIRIDLAEGYAIEECTSKIEWSVQAVKDAVELIEPYSCTRESYSWEKE